MFKPCLGESILLARSNDLWSQKRKSLASAFYKDKLNKMMDIIRDVVTNYAKYMDKEFFTTGKEFNLPSRINDL
jgi:NurA-like 5'-3' nuclease